MKGDKKMAEGYRGRIFKKDATNKTPVIIEKSNLSEVLKDLKDLIKTRQEDDKPIYNDLCYIDKKISEEKWVNIMRYDAKREKDVTKVFLNITGAKDDFLKKIELIKAENASFKEASGGKAGNLISFDGNEKKWYVTRDMDFRSLSDTVKQFLPSDYQYAFKAIAYDNDSKDPVIIYGESIREVLDQLDKYNPTRTDEMKMVKAYIAEMNFDTNHFKKAEVFLIDKESGRFGQEQSIAQESKKEELLKHPKTRKKAGEKDASDGGAKTTSRGKRQKETDESKVNAKKENNAKNRRSMEGDR